MQRSKARRHIASQQSTKTVGWSHAATAAVVGMIMQSTLHAHSVDSRFGDFYGGMLHPMTAMEHLFPILGFGLLAGQQGPDQARWPVILFPISLLIGSMFAIGTDVGPSIVWFNRISFVAIGLLVATAARIPFPILCALSILFGLSHGLENTAGVSGSATMEMFVPGVFACGLALVAIVAAIVVKLDRPWQQIAVRVVGSWIAAIGLLIIGLG